MVEADVLRMVASLALIVVIILGGAWLLRRAGLLRTGASQGLKIIGAQSLGARSSVVIVQVDDARLVVGVTPQQITLLHTMPPGDSVLAQQSSVVATQAGFARTLRSALAGNPPCRRGQYAAMRHVSVPYRPTPFKLPKALLWIGLLLLLFPEIAVSQALPAFTATTDASGSQTYSLSVQTLLLVTMLSFLPAMLLLMTGFTRIIIVLGLLRNAMGTGASPPNAVLIGIALFLTFFAMSPVFDDVYTQAYQPLSEGNISFETALERAASPMRGFMLNQTREADLALFANMAQAPDFDSPSDVPLRVLVPAFVTSELKTAFQIGFTVFIPFLIIDLVVASVLMALGMMMVPPVTISLPFKLMLFVLADGWHLLLGSLARSFYQ